MKKRSKFVKLDMMACWNDALHLLISRREAVLAVAGVFLLLPAMLLAQFVGDPDFGTNPTAQEMFAIYQQYVEDNFAAVLGSNLVVSFGTFVIFVLFSAPGGQIVAEQFKAALGLFLGFLIANLLVTMVVLGGLFLLVIPGVYLGGRLGILPMVMAAEREGNPIKALGRTWQVSMGNGWRIVLMLFVVALMGVFLVSVVTLVVGLVLVMIFPGEGWPFLTNLIEALLGTILSVIISAVVAAIYRQLVADTAPQAAV